jgi:hypothetical protein
MNRATAAEPITALEMPSRGSRWLPRSLCFAGLGVVTAVLFVFGYCAVFVFVQDYDDEGYILISVKEFLQGHALYDQVFSQYGPFFFLFHWVLAKFGLPILTHDTGRLATCMLWVASSLLGGLFVYRLTGRLWLAALSEAILFRSLFDLANEPGHPQAMCMFAIMFVVYVASHAGPGNRHLLSLAFGMIAGCLLLTKINVGIFVLLGLALSVSAATPGRAGLMLKVGAGLAALALPVLLMREHLGDPWARAYAAIVTLSMVPIVLLQWLQNWPIWRVRDWWVALLGILLAGALTLAFALATGSSPEALFQGVVLQHRHFASTYYIPFQLDRFGLPLFAVGFASIVALLVTIRIIQRPGRWSGWAIALGQAAFAVLVCYWSKAFVRHWAVDEDFDKLIAFAMPFAWLGAIGPASTPAFRFARFNLVAIAVAHSLVAYPVAGTQQALAAAMLVLVAGICLSDVLTVVVAALPKLGHDALLGRWAGFALALVVAYFYAHIGLGAVRLYERRYSLGLAGAERMRIDEAHGAAFRWLDANVRANSDTFLTMPGLNSLYLWAEKEPPTTWNATGWMTLFDAQRQQQIVAAADKYPRLCAIRHNRYAARWLRNQQVETLPLVRYVNDEFDTVGHFGGYEFRVRKGRARPELLACARPPLSPPSANGRAEWSGQLILPPMPDRQLAGLTVYLPAQQQALAQSTRAPGPGGLEVFADSAPDQLLDLDKLPLNLAAGSRLRLRLKSADLLPRNVPLIIQLVAPDGTVFAAVPILEG